MFDWLQRLFSPTPPVVTPPPAANPPVRPPAPAAPPPAAAAARAHGGLSFDQRDGIDNQYAGWLFG
jgi:hypothetical protein